MLAKSMIVVVTAAALAAGPTADAFAFSGGVSHVVTHPATRDQRAGVTRSAYPDRIP
jgi:hypothetical protein